MKKQNNFKIYNVAFKKKKRKKKNTCRYHYQNLNDIIYSSWDIEQNILKLVILGHFLPFYPLKTPKIKILKNEKICWRYHHFTHVYQKSQSYDVWFLRYGVQQTEFFVILDCFLPFYPLTTQKIKILKKWKKHLEISSFYICVPKIMIRWCTVPEIWCVTDVIVTSHFGLFFALLPP